MYPAQISLRHPASPASRSLAALGVLLVLALPLGALDHQAAHSPSGPLVHDEASHPNAAAHLEQEVHERAEECPICMHGAEKVSPSPAAAVATIRSASSPPAASDPPAGDLAWASHPPRAPPA